MKTPEPQPKYTFDRVVRMILGTAGFVAVVMLLRYLSDVLLPFAAAVVMAYLLNPIVTVFESRTHRRWLAVGMTIGGLTIAAVGVMALVVPLVYWQFDRFGRDLEKLRNDLTGSWLSVSGTPPDSARSDVGGTGSAPSSATTVQAPVSGTANDAKSNIGWRELVDGWERYRKDADQNPPVERAERLRTLRQSIAGTYMGDLLERGIKYVHDNALNLLKESASRLAGAGFTAIAFAVKIVVGLTGLVIVVIYLVFLLLDFPAYARTWKSFLPPGYRGPIVEFLTEFDAAMRRYFRGQSLVALITGSLYAIGFTIIGLPLGLPLAILIGLLSMVPYLAAVAIVPGLLLAVARSVEYESSLLASVLMLLGVFAVVQALQDTVVTPRVMGRATGLKPVVILLGVFIWGKLLGFLGILLAIPLTCLFIAYYRRYVLLHSRAATSLAGPAPAP